MNLDYIRKHKLDDKMIEMLNKEYHEYPDQDTINIVCKGKIKYISNTYNSTKTTGIVKNAKIIHYIAGDKGWVKESPRSEVWYKYYYERRKDMVKVKVSIPVGFNDLVARRIRKFGEEFEVTEERAEKVDFTLPYMNVALGVVSHEDNVITDLSQIGADDQVIVISGTTAETYLEKNYPDIKLQKFDTYASAKTSFENGTGVAWANDNTEVIAYAIENPGFVVGIPSLGSQDTIAPAVSKGNDTLADWLNEETVKLGEENFFHADYEATLIGTYGADYENTLVVEGGVVANSDEAEAVVAEEDADAIPNGNGETIKIAATPVPHAEILEEAAKILENYGYKLDVVEFDDYVQPNLVVESGEFDANYFQHVPYLDSFNAEQGTHLVVAGEIHYEPFGIYPGKKASLDEIADGDKIAIPNDTTNEARALLLLQDNGLITLKEGVGLTATVNDVVENPHNIEFVELEAAQVARVVKEVEYVILNGNYALEAGYSVGKDSIAYEASDSEAAKTYVNIVTVLEGNENSDKIQALVKVLRSDDIKKFIEDTYDGAVI